jgi:hypothetical protein
MTYAPMTYNYEANRYRNILCYINKHVLRPAVTNRVSQT